jgi:uncharacterized membrane protein YgcG
MYHHSDEELWHEAAEADVRQRLVERRRRCLQIAAALYVPGVAAVVFLCLCGLRPAAVSVPVFLTAMSLLLGSASAVLFARVAHLELADFDDGSDEDDGGPGGGSRNGPDPEGGGGLEVNWADFEREFRSYCERPTAVPA